MKIIIRKIACQGEHDQRDDFLVSDAGDSEKKNASTVTIRFSTQGAHSGKGAYFLFGKQPNVQDKTIIFI